MADRTRRDLIDMCLIKLGVLVPGQAPGDEPVSIIDNVIDNCRDQLEALGAVYIADIGTGNPPQGGLIDSAAFLPFASFVTYEAAGGFNLSDAPNLKALQLEAIETLRIIGRPARTRQTLRTDLQLTNTRIRAPIGNYSRGT